MRIVTNITLSALSEQQLAVLEQQVKSEEPNPSIQSQFNYAWALIKSFDREDNKHGIDILTDIFKNVPKRRRECLYYLSLGCYKIDELQDSKRYIEALLSHEPDNLQAIRLKKAVEDKLSKDGLIGVAILGGAVAIGAAALTTILSLGRKKR
ncbi:unnamed protein product [Kuraishia capsulata CBS 1993]|uniref:Mitochondrial fission 1 protein n=1 Tax=Kuraishia capsulata CBS 1993 TaxID=1382522 RepID=W6MS84_9ASCO|nr:uncharacterized protein KUCA_T00004048001 [Kuraishia capsulata CBS 1993]CDK28067.1 unnamed protein product [Kuraishia capsulata CBS 1993]